jgi:perosamine synthetase
MIPYGKHHLDEDDIQAVTDVLRSGALTQGPQVDLFEKAIADYVGVKYALAVSSGTAALHLAALAAGIGPGDAIATSPITFVASANASRYVGGDVVFVDVDKDSINMSPDALAEALRANPNVRAVIPVHFAGLPCDMTPIAQAAAKHGAVIIEDAAHALGASYPDGRKVGSCPQSLMTIFSFHPVKAIAAGEGGMVTTNDVDVYRRLLRLRSHGINKGDDVFLDVTASRSGDLANPWYYEMQSLGFNYRITDIQCALGLSQFAKLEAFVARRCALVKRYDAAFASIPRLHPAQNAGRDLSAHHIYPVCIDFAGLGLTRAEVMLRLREHGIGTQVHYIPVPAHPYYRKMGLDPLTYPNSNAYYAQALTLPLYFDLADEEQSFVIERLLEIAR